MQIRSWCKKLLHWKLNHDSPIFFVLWSSRRLRWLMMNWRHIGQFFLLQSRKKAWVRLQMGLFGVFWALTFSWCTCRCSSCRTCEGSYRRTWARSKCLCKSGIAASSPWFSRRGRGWCTRRPSNSQACAAWAFERRCPHLFSQETEIIIRYKPVYEVFMGYCWRLNLPGICCWRI